MSRWTEWSRTGATVVLAALAKAGLMASTTADLRNLVAIPIHDNLLIPGIVLIGALLTLVIGDTGRAAVSLLIAAVLGTLIYALAIAAPGFAVEQVRVQLIDRGTTYGMLALMLFTLFGLAGMILAWLVQMFVGTGEME
jgi:hypothetical protein